MRIILNDDIETVSEINKQLEEQKEKFGKKYCPCSLIKNEDTICPCKEFRENDKLGTCHCGKFVKIEN